MTARIIEIDLSDALKRDGYMFNCPLTGTPIIGDRDHAFENFASPYFLFCITEAGLVYSRSDELPEPIGSALKKVIKNLFVIGSLGPDGISSHEVEIYMPNEIAGMLPGSSVIFDIRGSHQRDSYSPRTWVVMDFTLPVKTVDEECIDHSAELVPFE